MIPVLFPESATTFQGMGLGALSAASGCRVVRQLNGMYELELTYPIIGRRFRELKPRAIIYATVGPGEKPQPFRIYRTRMNLMLSKTVYARHIAYDLMGCPMHPFPAGDLAATTESVTDMATSQGFPFTISSNFTSDSQCGITAPRSVWAMLGGQRGSMLDVYGGEWDFDMFSLTLRKRLGGESGVVIRYGKNLLSLEQDDDLANTWTAVYPFWTSIDGATTMVLPERTLSAGEFDYTRVLMWDASAEFEEAPTTEALRERTRRYISSNRVGDPGTALDLKWVPLDQTEEYKNRRFPGTVHLGDTVEVEYPTAADPKTGVPMDFYRAAARVVEIVWLPILDKYEYVHIGKKRANFVSALVQIQKDVSWIMTKRS